MVAREGARVLASLRTSTEALATIGRLQADIAIFDLHLMEPSIPDALRTVIADNPETTYRACHGNSPVGVRVTIPSQATRAITFWNGSAYSATCPSVDRGAQMVPLRVTVGTGGSAVTVDGVVVLRNPWAKP